MPDVIVVGGGVIGLTIAWELAHSGLQVSVLDQGEMGREASWAGAGMIPPGDVVDAATHPLAALSAQRWPELTAALKSETGLFNGYHRCGGVLLEDHRTVPQLAAAWGAHHLIAEALDGAQLQSIEPALGKQICSGMWLPEMAQVRNPHHVRALIAACTQLGVELIPHQQVTGWEQNGGKIHAALVGSTRYSAQEFVVTTGAWTGQFLQTLSLELPIAPVHGQIVLLQGPNPVFRRVIEQGGHYVVPRLDGRVLVGATEERIGFEKRNTPDAQQELLAFARKVVPALAEFQVETAWSGLRPWSGRKRPSLGRAATHSNLFIASGHYRAGLSNSPGTGVVMRQLILGEPPTIDLTAFAC